MKWREGKEIFCPACSRMVRQGLVLVFFFFPGYNEKKLAPEIVPEVLEGWETDMISLKIEDMKQFTSDLFIGTLFDACLVREAEIVTFNSFAIDGRMHRNYFTEQEREELQIEELSSWEMLKPFCFSLIRGKKLPERFHITFQLPLRHVEEFLKRTQLAVLADQIAGLYLNVRYENHELRCITGTSLRVFTLDKRLEYQWDEAVRLYLKKHKLPFVEE